MNKTTEKIAIGCLIGTMAFAGQMRIAEASELPVAGINLALSSFYEHDENTNTSIGDLLKGSIESEYENIGIAKVKNYVNIRSKPSTNSKVVGKLYKNAAARIVGKDGDWYEITSGKVKGYIKGNYLITGEAVEEIADSIATKVGTVSTEGLRVREEANTESRILSVIPMGEKVTVKKDYDDWVKVSSNDGQTGYVASAYINIERKFNEAISIEEEKAKIAKEEEESGMKLRNELVSYALRFQGNPYVWGGTSLTRGADCSGFTQSVFKHFGIKIPRNSRAQASSGRRVSVSNMKKGDLIFYSKNGRINHVAIYIGNGKVVGASSRKEGINVKRYNYRTITKVVRYL